MPGMRDPWHWVVLIVLVAILFGWKRLPDASRSLARSLRIFKNELTNDPKTPGAPVDGEVVTPRSEPGATDERR